MCATGINNIQCYYFCAKKKTGFDFMKFLIISLIILFSLSIGFVGVTQGEIKLKDEPSLVEVTVQIQLRDSEGRLVAYYEPTRTWVESELVHGVLDTKENKSIILKDGKNLEVIKWEQSKSFRGNELKMAYGHVAIATYSDGFISEPGDTFTESWKVVRPLN